MAMKRTIISDSQKGNDKKYIISLSGKEKASFEEEC